MNINDLMNEMQTESKNKAIETDCYGFSHREFMGKEIKASSYIINTNSKEGVCQTSWYVDGKKMSRAKFIAVFS